MTPNFLKPYYIGHIAKMKTYSFMQIMFKKCLFFAYSTIEWTICIPNLWTRLFNAFFFFSSRQDVVTTKREHLNLKKKMKSKIIIIIIF